MNNETSVTAQNEYLDVDELRALTGFARSQQQVGWLQKQGLPHRRDGRRVIVSRIHVRHWLEGRHTVSSNGLNLAGIK